MNLLDINEALSQYDSMKKNSSSGNSNKSNETDKQDAARIIQSGLQNNIKVSSDKERLEFIENLEKSKDVEIYGRKYDMSDVQKYIMASFTNALNISNAQKIIIMSNRENMRKGFEKQIESGGGNNISARAIGKGQISTVAIPTRLLHYVQHEIGGLDIKVTQNDIITGFLYWYFGKPDDVSFGSKETCDKIEEIISKLDLNASPSKFSQVSYNTSNTLLDRIEAVYDKIETILSIVAGLTKDSLESKIKNDKMYIALCYNVLNMLAFTPPVMPGEQPEDIDLLAGGTVWDLMSGIDTAYDYYKTKNGRELYKSKVRKRVNTFNYTPAQTIQSNDDYNNYDDYSESYHDDSDDMYFYGDEDGYTDVYNDYDDYDTKSHFDNNQYEYDKDDDDNNGNN